MPGARLNVSIGPLVAAGLAAVGLVIAVTSGRLELARRRQRVVV
jgi:hypothetical protein